MNNCMATSNSANVHREIDNDVDKSLLFAHPSYWSFQSPTTRRENEIEKIIIVRWNRKNEKYFDFSSLQHRHDVRSPNRALQVSTTRHWVKHQDCAHKPKLHQHWVIIWQNCLDIRISCIAYIKINGVGSIQLEWYQPLSISIRIFQRQLAHLIGTRKNWILQFELYECKHILVVDAVRYKTNAQFRIMQFENFVTIFHFTVHVCHVKHKFRAVFWEKLQSTEDEIRSMNLIDADLLSNHFFEYVHIDATRWIQLQTIIERTNRSGRSYEQIVADESVISVFFVRQRLIRGHHIGSSEHFDAIDLGAARNARWNCWKCIGPSNVRRVQSYIHRIVIIARVRQHQDEDHPSQRRNQSHRPQ